MSLHATPYPKCVRKKLEWAREHLNGLKGEILKFFEGKPYETRPHHEEKWGEFVLDHTIRTDTIHRTKEIPPEISLRAADVVHSLRSSLDHLQFAVTSRYVAPAIAERLTRKDSIANQLQFPIHDLPAEYRDRIRRRAADLMLPPHIEAVFESLQPYQRPHPTRPDILSILRDISNVDKHRWVAITLGLNQSSSIWLAGPRGQEASLISSGVTVGPFVDGAIVATVKIPASVPKTDVHVYTKLGVEIAFDEEWPAFGFPMHATLEYMHNFIRDRVFPPLEAFLA